MKWLQAAAGIMLFVFVSGAVYFACGALTEPVSYEKRLTTPEVKKKRSKLETLQGEVVAMRAFDEALRSAVIEQSKKIRALEKRLEERGNVIVEGTLPRYVPEAELRGLIEEIVEKRAQMMHDDIRRELAESAAKQRVARAQQRPRRYAPAGRQEIQEPAGEIED